MNSPVLSFIKSNLQKPNDQLFTLSSQLSSQHLELSLFKSFSFETKFSFFKRDVIYIISWKFSRCWKFEQEEMTSGDSELASRTCSINGTNATITERDNEIDKTWFLASTKIISRSRHISSLWMLGNVEQITTYHYRSWQIAIKLTVIKSDAINLCMFCCFIKSFHLFQTQFEWHKSQRRSFFQVW